MAIYHLSAQIISRGAGRSSVAAAAYRAGERLEDECTGLVHDYGRRRDIDGWVQAPDHAPDWVYDRQALWNAVEAAERRHDAQLARELNVALPVELDREQQQEALWDYVAAHFVDCGMVADVAFHHGDPHNPHAHIMLTMRGLTPDGFGSKVRDWNDRALLRDWREGWERHVNDALERAGRDERVDHRSLTDQGLDRLPTVQEGPTVREMEARGIRTDRGTWNREIAEHTRLGPELAEANRQLDAVKDAAAREDWIDRRAAVWEHDGYTPAAAWALAGSEHDDHGRRPFRTLAEARATIAARDQVLTEANGALWREWEALRQLDATRARYERDVAALAEHAGGGARLARLISGDAREAYRRAQGDYAHSAQALARQGGDDAAAVAARVTALAERAVRWERACADFLPLRVAGREIECREAAAHAAERARSRGDDREADRGDDFGR